MISFSKGVSKLQRAHSKFILTVVYPKGLEMYGDLICSKKNGVAYRFLVKFLYIYIFILFFKLLREGTLVQAE